MAQEMMIGKGFDQNKILNYYKKGILNLVISKQLKM
jgi:hypothetical protein